MVYGFAKVTHVTSVYEFSGFFLIELNFYYTLFFSHTVKKIVEKNHVIKFYKVIKIKGCEETIVYHTHYIVNDNSNLQCFASFLFSFLL